MKGVGARLGHHVHSASLRVLRRKPSGFHIELLDRVGKGHRHGGRVDVVVVGGAVQRVARSEADAAAHRNPRQVRASGVEARRGRLDGSTGKRDQVGHAPAVQRQLENPLVLNDLAYTGVPCLDERGVGLNLNLFADLSDCQHRIDGKIRVHLQHHSHLHKSSESCQRGL